MEFMIRGRQGGKTTAMLQWMREAPDGEARIMVCHSLKEAAEMMKAHREFASWQFVPIEDFRSPGVFSGVKLTRKIVLGIDDLDRVLQRILGTSEDIGLVTATGSLYWAGNSTKEAVSAASEYWERE